MKNLGLGANVLRNLSGVQQFPKLKGNQQDAAKLKPAAQLEECKGRNKGGSSADEDAETSSQKENSPPPPTTAKRTRGREPGTTKKAAGAARGRGAAAAAKAAIAASPTNSQVQDVPVPKQTAAAQAPAEKAARPPAGRDTAAASQPSSRASPGDAPAADKVGRLVAKRDSSGADAGMTGEEIWKFNLQLGKIAESLADPEDLKPTRKRYKSPTLQEKLRKEWGGTYEEVLEKEFAPLDVEEPPAPTYEPPLFLQETVDSDDDEAPPPPAPAPAGNKAKAQPARRPAPTIDLVTEDPMEDPGPGPSAAAALDTKKGAGTGAAAKAPGRSRPPAAKGKDGAGAAAGSGAAAARGASAMDVEETGKDVEAAAPAAGPGDKAREGEEEPRTAQQQRRRGGKAAAAAAAPPQQQQPVAKAAPARGGAKRGARAAAAAAAAAEPDHAEPPAPVEAPSTSAVAPIARGRKTHLPPGLGFGNSAAAARPAPSVAGTTTMDEFLDDDGGDVIMPMAGPGAGTLTTGQVKRSRESMAMADTAARCLKASRLDEQQTIKEMETLRQRIKELEQKCNDLSKQREGEAKAVERRAEKDRQQAASDLATEQRENARLKAALEERDVKIAELREELKQRATDAKELKADFLRFTARLEQMAKVRS